MKEKKRKEDPNKIQEKVKKSHRNEINSSIYTYEIVLECKEKSL